MKTKTIVAILAAAALSAPLSAETLDNEAIVQLVDVGLGEEAIIAKIDATASRFDVTTNQLIGLKNAGVPSSVIAAMIAKSNAPSVSTSATVSMDDPDPMVPHASGGYLMADWLPDPKMQ